MNQQKTGRLDVILSEDSNSLLFYSPMDIAHRMKTTQPNLEMFMSALRNAGYSASFAHCHSQG